MNSKFKGNMARRNIIKGLGIAGISAATAGIATTNSIAQDTPPAEDTSLISTERPLEGKVAIVTGARANIGRGIAIGLAEMGANILVHYHRPETVSQAEETARLAREAGAKQTALAVGDLGKRTNVTQMFDLAESELGGADIIVNNAGKIIKKPIAELTDEEYLEVWNINEWGTFLCMREAANRLSNRGRIINIVTAIVPSITANYGGYAGPKAANAQLVRTLSAEIGGSDRAITVNSVHPGPVDTPFFREPESDRAIEYAQTLANLQRLGRVSDVVPVVQFLASPAAQWMTGESIFVTGGYAES